MTENENNLNLVTFKIAQSKEPLGFMLLQRVPGRAKDLGVQYSPVKTGTGVLGLGCIHGKVHY